MSTGDAIEVRRLWVGGPNEQRSLPVPIELHNWWQSRFRTDTDPGVIKYLRLNLIDGRIECRPMREYRRPSGRLDEYVVPVTPYGPKMDRGKFAIPRRLMDYILSQHPNIKEMRIVLENGWFVCEPV